MIAVSRRTSTRAAILIAGLTSVALGEVLEFRTALGSTTSPVTAGRAAFTSVEAIPQLGPNNPARAYVGGFFSDQLGLGQANPLSSSNREDGVLAALSNDPAGGGWNADWLLQVRCDGGNARINDVALSPGGEIFVTGTFEGDVSFDLSPPANPITFVAQPPGAQEGFVAWADPTGSWINAFPVRGMLPNSIALDDQGNIYLTGRPDLARCYDQAGNPIWNTPEPPETISLRHIVLRRDAGPFLYVQGSLDSNPAVGAVNEDVFVAQLDQFTGQEIWNTAIASGGEDHPGGLGIGPFGEVRAAVSSNGSNLNVNGIPVQEVPILPGRHGHLLFLTPDGNYRRDNLLGNSVALGGNMETHDLSIDQAGNNYVSVSFVGPFEFEGVQHGGQEDAAVVAIDTVGTPMRFTDTTGGAQALGNAVASPDRNLQIMVGALRGTAPENFDGIPVPAGPQERGFFGAIEPSDNQESYILTSTLNEPLDDMAQRITQAGGEVYRTLDLPNENVRMVSAYLTTQQLARLDNFFDVTIDSELFRDGTVSSTWHLAWLNSISSVPSYSYTYPETCSDAVLYLIDTSVDTSSGYFAGNPNLTFGASNLVRGIGEPNFPSAFDHGTEMLSMIAGPTNGAAQGSPVTVITYDIYPDGVSAKLSALVEAISLANSDKAANYPYDPAVYCVASSAITPGKSSSSLEAVVDYAIGSAVYSTIVFSAGNTAGDAQDYTPSDLGSKPGVICTGAIDMTNSKLAGTRGNPGVDLWAPGDAVPAADVAGLATTVSGTSSATALVAGTALAYLSGNPFATPADLETAMVSTHAQAAGIGRIVHVPLAGAPGFLTLTEWAAWYGVTEGGNDDGDHWSDKEEFVWGLDPLSYDYQGSVVDLTFAHNTSTLTFEFPLSCALYQPSALNSPYTLRDGSTLSVERSEDLHTWSDITNTLTLTEVSHSGGQVKLSFDYVVSATRCFFRVKVK